MELNLDGVVGGLIFMGLLMTAILWGGWEIIDWLFIDDAIKVSKPITPEIEIIVKDNVIDTLFVYRKQ
jgi:hypothetical protein